MTTQTLAQVPGSDVSMGRDGADGGAAAAGAASQQCTAIGDILARVGDKWSMLVVMQLLGGAMRFNALKREIAGISQQMLARTLRALERDGMVTRSVRSTVPVQVDYALTPVGHSLSLPVRELGAWALAHRSAIERSRQRYDAQA